MAPWTKIFLFTLLSVSAIACQADTASERSEKSEPVLPISGPAANTEIEAALATAPDPFEDNVDDSSGDGDKITPSFDPDNPGQIYIPKDLDDCFAELDRMLPPEFIEQFKAGGEGAAGEQHFGLGLWMRNNWRLWGASRLKTYLTGEGLFHPDDMSGVILTSYQRYLNQQPIELEMQIKKYQDFWMKKTKPRRKLPHAVRKRNR